MKAQQLVQSMVPRALFGGVWNTSKSVYSSGSQLLLSRPSVSGAYLKKYTRIQLHGVSAILFLVRSSCLSFFYRLHLYCFQHVAADVFSFLVSIVLFPVRSRCVFFSCHRIISHDRIYVERMFWGPPDRFSSPTEKNNCLNNY